MPLMLSSRMTESRRTLPTTCYGNINAPLPKSWTRGLDRKERYHFVSGLEGLLMKHDMVLQQKTNNKIVQDYVNHYVEWPGRATAEIAAVKCKYNGHHGKW